MRISDWSSDVCSSDLLPVLVLPFAGLELAFDIDLAALAQIAFGHIGKTFAEDRDRMPFGLFLALAGVAVLPRFGRGDAQIDHLAAVLERPAFRIAAEIPDQDHFVNAAGHVVSRVATNRLLMRSNRSLQKRCKRARTNSQP